MKTSIRHIPLSASEAVSRSLRFDPPIRVPSSIEIQKGQPTFSWLIVSVYAAGVINGTIIAWVLTR